MREHFFGKYPAAALVGRSIDEQIWALNRGGHDPEESLRGTEKRRKLKAKRPIPPIPLKVGGMGRDTGGRQNMLTSEEMNMDGVRYVRAIVSTCLWLPMLISKNCRTLPSRKVLKNTNGSA